MGIEATMSAPVASAKLMEIKDHLNGIREELEDMPPIPSDAMSYSELKMQLMANYIANLSFYISLKQSGEKVAQHPVFKHLAMLRTFMERLAPLDATLKYQIDKLLMEDTETSDQPQGEADSAAAPNLQAFVPSVSSAVKSITVDQVKKSIAAFNMPTEGGSMEIDPSLIAAQIQKAQARATTKKRKVKTYVEKDSEDERIDEDDFSEGEQVKPKKSKKKQAVSKKPVVDEDDEEIESDFEL